MMNENHKLMIAIIAGVMVSSGMAIFGIGEERNYSIPVHPLGCIPENITPTDNHSIGFTAPPSWDWKSKGIMTSVKNQGNCGSCVAFACNGAFEAIIKWKIGQSVDLSEAQVFFCTGSSCDSGMYVSTALNYMKNSGVADENCFPYGDAFHGANLPCSPCDDWQQRAYHVNTWGTVTGTSNIKEYLVNYGPLIVTYEVYTDFDEYWYNPSAWENEVYVHTHGTSRGYHAVVLVGYNDDGGYWICKNSWGASGGLSGYFKIGYGEPAGSSDRIDDAAYYLTYKASLVADAHGPYKGRPNQNIQFYGSAYGGKTPYTWHWDFGDGTTSNEQNPTHAYSKAGVYTVTLTVTDANGQEAYDTAKVTVNTPPSSPTISGPVSGKVNKKITFSVKSIDNDGDNVKYIINWGDGKSTTTGFHSSGKSVSVGHTWYDTGRYIISVRAEDERGERSSTAYHSIEIGSSDPPYKPSLIYPPNNSTGIEISPVLSWRGGDPDGDEVHYTIYFGTDRENMSKIADNITETNFSLHSLQPFTRYYWKVVAYDETGLYTEGDIWNFKTKDIESPYLEIIKPMENYLYISNFSIPFVKTFVIGKIMVEVNATDTQSGIDRVEFYVDGILMENISNEPYKWLWNEDTLYDTHTLKVIAYDRDGNKAEKSMEVTVLNIFQ